MPFDGADDAFGPVFAQLAASAHRANLARSEVLERALRAVERDEARPEQVAEAVRAAHQLVGSAGTFGHRQASRRAAVLERYFADPEGLRQGWSQAVDDLAALRADLTEGAGDPAADEDGSD